MTDTERAFLLAAAADPADDAVRLVYSDWLEEQPGEAMTAHAQFVRLQVARAKLVRESPGQPVAPTRRERQLERQYRRNWNGRVHRLLHDIGTPHRVDARHGGIRGWEYTRGMVSSITLSAYALSDFYDEITRLGPVRRLVLVGSANGIYGDTLKKLIAVPKLHFHIVELRNTQYLDSAFDIMGCVPVLDLRRVELGLDISTRTTQAYRARPGFQSGSRGVTLYNQYIGPGYEVRRIDPHNVWPQHRAEFAELTGYTGDPPRYHG